jgi:hypothetical protein
MQRARGDVTQQWELQQTLHNYATISEACFYAWSVPKDYKRRGIWLAVSNEAE